MLMLGGQLLKSSKLISLPKTMKKHSKNSPTPSKIQSLQPNTNLKKRIPRPQQQN